MPESLRGVFPSNRLPALQQYAGLLATEGVLRGLIGPREVPRLWERHLENCALLTEVLPTSGTLCDIGSGAGLPGVVVALALPELHVTLVEPLLRRTVFLQEVVDELGLSNVEVVRGRADSLHGRRSFDVVTSRAVAPLDRLLEWSMPLVADRGELIALKGSSAVEEVAGAASLLAELKCGQAEVLGLGAGGSGEAETGKGPQTFAVRVSWGPEGRVAWPVRSGAKNPNARSRRPKPSRERSRRPGRS